MKKLKRQKVKDLSLAWKKRDALFRDLLSNQQLEEEDKEERVAN
jgi:hypothetical protein